MPNSTLANLGVSVRNHRGKKTLRQAAKEIGIGAATLMRVEAGHLPDVATYGRICAWLKVDPGKFLGFSPAQVTKEENDEPFTLISAHLRANATQQDKTVQSLAKMILVATRRQKPDETDVDT